MAINSNATPGIEITSPAKWSDGAAATLGSPASSASNNVIVPDAITANNEGNLESTPSYVGRMFMLRPWEMKWVSGGAINAPGSGYVVNDIITLPGGVAGTGGKPQLRVTAVDGGGGITDFEIERDTSFIWSQGLTSAVTSSPPAATSFSLSGGSGSGATFNYSSTVWEPWWELRYITGDSSNTLTVHEDWIEPPKSGDRWAVSYILEDVATVNGCTLRTQSGVFEFTRRLNVATVAGSYAFFSINDGKQMETDNTTAPLRSYENSMFTIGYLQDGAGVNGGYISTSDTTNRNWNFHWGALFYFYDLQMRSPRAAFDFDILESSAFALTDIQKEWRKQMATVVQNSKFFDAVSIEAELYKIRGVTYQSADGLNGTIESITTGVGSPNVERSDADIDGMVLINYSAGVTTLGTGLTDHYYNLRNIQWVNSQIGRVNANETMRLVNPVYNLDLTGQGGPRQFEFLGDGGQFREYFSLIVNVVDTDANSLSGVSCYMYEGVVEDALLGELSNRSLTAAVTDFRFLESVGGLVRYVTDVVNNVYTPASPFNSSTLENPRGLHVFRSYLYGRIPNLTAVTPRLKGGVELQVSMLLDEAITKSTASSALSISPQPTVSFHGTPNPGLESPFDPEKMIAFLYDGGTGTLPSIGDTITGTGTSPQPTGTVADVIGDAASGVLLIENWNAVAWTDNLSIQDGAGWTALVNRGQSPEFYETYTILVDAQGNTANNLYDYLAARMAEFPITPTFEEVIVWGGNDSTATQLMFSNGSGFFTRRSIKTALGSPVGSVGEGVWISNRGSGSYDFFTSDSGQIYEIPVQLTITLTGLVPNTEVTVCTQDGTTVSEIENTGSPNTFSFNIDSGVSVDIIIHNVQYEHIRIENISFSGDTSIPISQRFDRNYENPVGGPT